MSNAVASRLGQVNQTGTEDALFLKIYGGEVLTTFEKKVTLKELTRQRTISNGKSAQFPATYKASGGYHTPGAELLGRAISHNEVTITVDGLLVTDVFVASIDEAKTHYEYRSTYTTEQGRFLAEQYDANIARNLCRSARSAALFAGDQGGTVLNKGAAGLDTAAELIAAITEARQVMDEADLPVEDEAIRCALQPAEWYLILQDDSRIINTDIRGSDGNFGSGRFRMINGVECVKSNNYPWGVDDRGNTDIPQPYAIDMTNTVAVVFHESAVATLNLVGMNVEAWWDPRRRGTWMIAEYACGHGPLVFKGAVELTQGVNG